MPGPENGQNADPASQYHLYERSLAGRELTAGDYLELAQRASRADLPLEAKLHVWHAGELDPLNPAVAAAVRAASTVEEFAEWQQRHMPEVPFWRDLKRIFLFPATQEGLMMLALASACLTIRQLFDGLFLLVPALSLILGLAVFVASGVAGMFTLLLLPSFFLSIAWRASFGKPGFPDWPSFSDFFGMLAPSLKMLAVGLWSYLPLVIYLSATVRFSHAPSPLLSGLLLLLGCAYFPMALLLFVITGKLWPSLLVSNIVQPIVLTFSSYWKLVLLLIACSMAFPLCGLIGRVPGVGATLAVFCGLYATACIMHLLGRFYRLEGKRLTWI
jgi:hypothetical protein